MAEAAEPAGTPAARELLGLWRLAGEEVPRDELADALLRSRPGVAQAYYLGWQAAAGTYAELGSGRRLPPGPGDPAQASDVAVFAQLAAAGELSVEALCRLP